MATGMTNKRKAKQNKKLLQARKALVSAGLILGVGVLMLVAWADTHPRPAPPALPALNTPTAAQTNADSTAVAPASAAVEPSKTTASASRHSVDFYSQGIRSGMFSEPQPPAPPAVTAPAKPAPVVASSPDPEPSLVPETPVNPFADWSYTGLITQGDQKMALLENTKTKEGQYVQVGDTFLSARVENVSDQMVALRDSGKPYSIPKSDTITVVPLDKSAPYLSENSAPTTPANPQEAQASQVPSAPNGIANGLADQFAAMQQMRRQLRGMGRGRRMGGAFNPPQLTQPTGQ